MMSPRAGRILDADPRTQLFRREMLRTLDGVVHAAQAEGVVRADVDTGDVAMLFTLLLHQLPARYSQASRSGPERCLALMLDGLRAHPGTPLPGRPLTSADLDT
jgi:hypothetical protein